MTVPDAVYIVIARRLGCVLLTGDHRLAGAPNLGVTITTACPTPPRGSCHRPRVPVGATYLSQRTPDCCPYGRRTGLIHSQSSTNPAQPLAPGGGHALPGASDRHQRLLHQSGQRV